jgi:hypothetical protein
MKSQSGTARFDADKTAQFGHPDNNADFITNLVSLAKGFKSVDEYNELACKALEYTPTFHYMASLYNVQEPRDVFESNNLLFYFLKQKPDEFVKSILPKLDMSTLLGVKDIYGNNLLHMAVFYRYAEVTDSIFDLFYNQELFAEFVDTRNKDGTNPLGMMFINSSSYNASNLLVDASKKIVKSFIKHVKYDINSYLNNKLGMDYAAETYLKHIGGFNILHMVLKCGAKDLLSDLGLRNEEDVENPNDYVNFFHPALNPDFHMTSPTRLLDYKSIKFPLLKEEMKRCEPLLVKAQIAQQEKLDEDGSGDSEVLGTPANFYKQELQNLAKFAEKKIEKASASSLDYKILNTPLKASKQISNSQASEKTDLSNAVTVFFHGVPLMLGQYGNFQRRELAKKLLPANPRIDEEGKVFYREETDKSALSIHSRTSTASSEVSNLHDIVSRSGIVSVLSNMDENLRLYLSKCQQKDKTKFLGAVKVYVYEFADNPIKKFWDILRDIEEPSDDLGIIKYRFPFISVSKAPDHPLKFGIGQNVETQARGELSLNPKYNKDGFPSHRLAGFLYVTRHSLGDIQKLVDGNSCIDVTQLVKSGQLSAKGSTRTDYQHEFTFFGGVKAEDVLFVVPVVYPNFKKGFQKSHHDVIWNMIDGTGGPGRPPSNNFKTAKDIMIQMPKPNLYNDSGITSVGKIMMPAFVKLALNVAEVLLQDKNVILLNANNDLETFSFDYDSKSYWSYLQKGFNGQKASKTTPEKLSEQKRWQENLKKQDDKSDVCRKLFQDDEEENTSILIETYLLPLIGYDNEQIALLLGYNPFCED